MPKTFLALSMTLIPQETKDNISSFWLNKFSNDNSRILLAGYSGTGELLHSTEKMLAWVQWEQDPQAKITELIQTAIEYTKDEIQAEFANPESIWYSAPVSDE